MLKDVDQHVAQRAAAYLKAFSRYTLGTPTVMEIVKGLHKQKQPKKLKQFLSQLSKVEVLPLDQACAEIAGRIYGDLERTGQPVGRVDPMSAGIALEHGLVLVTGNTEHYQRVKSFGYRLQLDNWRQPSTA